MNLQCNKIKFAPIVLFLFKRPEHTRRTLESLARNIEFSESQLFIYCDGARNNDESTQVEEVRQVAREWPHPNKVIIERDFNFGLANSIIDGVTNIVNQFGCVIVIEDDLVTSPYFLKFMNDGLRVYENDQRVASIHSYVYPINDLPEIFFMRGADCWGWATWQNRWDLFEPNGKKLLDELKRTRQKKHFDFNGSYPFTKMLSKQVAGKNDSWAIRWHASAYLKNKFTLHPGKSLVQNIGTDGTGTHCVGTSEFATILSSKPIRVELISVEVKSEVFTAFERHFCSIGSGFFVRIQHLFRRKCGAAKLIKPIRIIRFLLPPFVISLARSFQIGYGYFGNYTNWESAKKASSGYDARHILNKVKQASLKVKLGEAAYERDSVLFESVEYSWPVLAGLLLVASQNESRLNVLDFGGSLGSSYFQNNKLLSHLKEFNWNVVEQSHFVQCGRAVFQDEFLRFYESIDACLLDNNPNVVLLSGVLSYLEDVDNILADILSREFQYIIVDKTPFVTKGNDRITVQKVPPWIYEGSYPCRFFNETKLIDMIVMSGYKLVADFVNTDCANVPSTFKGFIFRRDSLSVKSL